MYRLFCSCVASKSRSSFEVLYSSCSGQRNSSLVEHVTGISFFHSNSYNILHNCNTNIINLEESKQQKRNKHIVNWIAAIPPNSGGGTRCPCRMGVFFSHALTSMSTLLLNPMIWYTSYSTKNHFSRRNTCQFEKQIWIPRYST